MLPPPSDLAVGQRAPLLLQHLANRDKVPFARLLLVGPVAPLPCVPHVGTGHEVGALLRLALRAVAPPERRVHVERNAAAGAAAACVGVPEVLVAVHALQLPVWGCTSGLQQAAAAGGSARCRSASGFWGRDSPAAGWLGCWPVVALPAAVVGESKIDDACGADPALLHAFAKARPLGDACEASRRTLLTAVIRGSFHGSFHGKLDPRQRVRGIPELQRSSNCAADGLHGGPGSSLHVGGTGRGSGIPRRSGGLLGLALRRVGPVPVVGSHSLNIAQHAVVGGRGLALSVQLYELVGLRTKKKTC